MSKVDVNRLRELLGLHNIDSYKTFHKKKQLLSKLSPEDVLEIHQDFIPFSETFNIKRWVGDWMSDGTFVRGLNQYSLSYYNRDGVETFNIGLFLFHNEEEIVDDIKGMFIPILESKGYFGIVTGKQIGRAHV